ncbi:MAG TPA: hypothetical protein VK141_02955 [Nitrosomonas sp.]|nr:hypothetical protein [Nitrosomonas sp.]
MYQCPYCKRVSETDQVCQHGNAKVSMKPYKTIPGSRFEIFHFNFDTSNPVSADDISVIRDPLSLKNIGLDIESINLVNPNYEIYE